MKLTLILVGLLILTFTSFAQEFSNISGTNIKLKIQGTGISGTIKGSKILGYFDEETGVSELTIRKDSKSFKTIFQGVGGRIGGTISHSTAGSYIETDIEFSKLHSGNIVAVKINGEEYLVRISSTGLTGGKFVTPTFQMNYKGETLRFSLEGQDASLGLSIHLIFMIFGTFIHI